MVIYGKIKDLSFKPNNNREYLDFLEQNEGKEVEVEINVKKSRRSLDANAYLWGVVYKIIALHTGHSEQEIHEYMKRICLPPVFKKIMGKEIKMPRSTSDLNKSDFYEYIEKIRAEVSTLGIIIPEANSENNLADIKKIYSQLEVPDGEIKF